jgi:hypothetical protein
MAAESDKSYNPEELKETSFSHKIEHPFLREIEYNEKKVSILQLPKGILLFRAGPIDCGISDIVDNVYYVTDLFQSFFYIYPFYTTEYGREIHFVSLNEPIDIVCGVYPSKINRTFRRDEYDVFRSCNVVQSKIGNVEFPEYDACLLPAFKEATEVKGIICLAKQDTHKHIEAFSNYNKYAREMSLMWSDSTGNIGVPEIILTPYKEKYPEIGTMADCSHLPMVYDVVYSGEILRREFMERIERDEYLQIDKPVYATLKKISPYVTDMMRFLSPAGMNGKHMTVFLPLMMFCIYEDVEDEYKKWCVPISFTAKSKLQTFQVGTTINRQAEKFNVFEWTLPLWGYDVPERGDVRREAMLTRRYLEGGRRKKNTRKIKKRGKTGKNEKKKRTRTRKSKK